MNDDLYWSILDQSWKATGKSPYDALKDKLDLLSILDLLSFSKKNSDYRNLLNKPSHLCAAYLVNEGVISGEIFSQYTESVAGVPRVPYLEALDNPDALLDHVQFQDAVQLDAYPFSSLPVVIGKGKFGGEWISLSKQQEWKSESTNIELIEVQGRKGGEIISSELCRRLVPRLYSSFHERCGWP